MVQTNFAAREVELKILYYGLPNAGKLTNLQALVQKAPSECCGDIKEEKKAARVYSMEYSAPESFQIGGMRVRCFLSTVSSAATDTKEYFQGVDGIVFVVDSQSRYEREQVQALDILEKNLKENGHNFFDIPLVFEWNKQDLADIKDAGEWNTLLNERGVPARSACATSAEGVKEILDLILAEVSKKVEEQLRSPSKRLPKKKLGIGLGKKEEHAEDQAIEPIIMRKPEELQPPVEEGKSKLKLNLPKLKTKIEEEKASKAEAATATAPKISESDEEEIAISTSAAKATKSSPEESKPAIEPIVSQKEPEEPEEPVEPPKQSLAKAPETATEQTPRLLKLVPRSAPATTSEPGDEASTKTAEPQRLLKLAPRSEPKTEPSQEKSATPVPSTKEGKLEKRTTPAPEAKESKAQTAAAPDDEPKQDFQGSEDKDTSELFAKEPAKKLKQLKRLFPKKSMDEALQLLEEGKTLENAYLDILDLSNRTFSKKISIVKCQIGKLLADGGDFKSSFIMESTIVTDSLTLCGESPTLFRDVVHFKSVEVVGAVNLERCIFTKDVTIADCTFESLLKMPGILCDQGLSIMNSRIAGLACQKSQVRGPLLITGSTFDTIASFQKSSFYGTFLVSSANFQRVHFIDAFFKERVEFSRCIFEKSGNWGKISCEKGISLEGCVFNGMMNLGDAYLKGESYIRRTEFCSDASLNKMLVNGTLILEKASFSAMADFSGANLGRTEFLQTVFHGDANFQDTVFSENTSLVECIFEQAAYFTRAIFLQKVDFRNTQWTKQVSFANVVGEYIIINREQVQNKLAAEYQKNYEVLEQEYLTLKQVFEKQRYYNDRDWAHYNAKRAGRQKIRFSLLHPFRTLNKIGNWFFWDLGCGYGTKPANIIILSFFLVTIFAGLYGSLCATQLNFPEKFADKCVAAGWHSVMSFMPAGIFFTEVGFQNFNFALGSLTLNLDAFLKIGTQVLPGLLMIVQNLLGSFFIFLFLLTLVRRLLQD